jgi:general secretion pathway protein E
MNNHRHIEYQLAPAYNAFLKAHPPTPEDSRTSERTQRLLEDAVAGNVSDIHIDPQDDNYRIRFRLDGTLHDVATLPIDAGERMLRYLRTSAELDAPKPHEAQEGRAHFDVSSQPWELRIATVPAAFGEKAALRLLSRRQLQKRVADLGMSETTLSAIRDWMSDSTGMLIVAGPTGSGKTTTLYALLHELKSRQRSIVTIEDPIEYPIEGITQIEVHPANGMNFAEGLKTMLRLDPDYLLVGEVRDRESASTAIDAAGAGRILMTTLHSRDAAGAVTMLRNYGVEDHEVSSALEMIVAQRLVRKLCEKCRSHCPPNDTELRWLSRIGVEPPKDSWHAVGCDACSQTGFDGRIGIFEVWRLSPVCKARILKHADESELRKLLVSTDQPILLQDALTKASVGCTTLEEIQGMGAGTHGFTLTYPHRMKM